MFYYPLKTNPKFKFLKFIFYKGLDINEKPDITQNIIHPEFPYKRVWDLAWPNIMANILGVCISFGHMMIAAPLGPNASFAVITGGRIHFLLMSLIMALSIAATALVARAWGAKAYDEASAAASASIGFALFISIILSIAAYFGSDLIAGAFTQDPNLVQLTRDYLKPIAIFNILFAFGTMLATGLRAIGDVKRPMNFLAFSAVINLLSAYTFSTGQFGFPAYGLSGIIWGGILAQAFSLVIFIARWFLGHYEIKPVYNAFFDFKRYRPLISIGAPAALEQIAIQTGFLCFMVIIGTYGTAAFAGYGIGISLLGVCIVIGLGFGAAGATLTGQTLGAGQLDNIHSSGFKAMQMAIITMSIVAIIFYVFRAQLALLLSNDPATQELTIVFVTVLAISQPLMAIEFSIGGALRGAGDTKYPLYVTLIAMVITRLLIGIIAWKLGASINFMYSIILIDYLIKAIMLIKRFQGDNWITAAGKAHAPSALQGDVGVNRTAVREYYTSHPNAELPSTGDDLLNK